MIKLGIWKDIRNNTYLYGFIDKLCDGTLIYENPELRDYIMNNEYNLQLVAMEDGHRLLEQFCKTNKHVCMLPDYWNKDMTHENLIEEFNAPVYVMTPVGLKQIH